MSCCNRKAKENKLAVILSIIAAVTGYFIFSTAVVTNLPLLLNGIVTFALYVLLTLIVLSILPIKWHEKCICKYGPLLLYGCLGAIISSLITLSITVSVTILPILIAIVILFSSLTIFEFFFLMLCVVKQNCRCVEC